MLNRFLYVFLFAVLLLIEPINAQFCLNYITGTIRFNNQTYQGAEVRVRNYWIDGTYTDSDIATTSSSGTYYLELCNFNWSYNGSNLLSRVVRIYYPLSCPYDAVYKERSWVGILQDHSYNYVASPPSGNGIVSGTIYVNGSPAPYHTKAYLYRPNGTMVGWSQPTNNNGTYSFAPTTTPYGTNRLEVKVYTQPNITTQNFYFCVNEPNEVFNPNLSIPGFQTGYMVGNVRFNCTNIPNNIVYFKPTTPNGMAQGWVVTNAQGNYTGYNLPVGTYNFWTTYNGVTKTYTRTIQAGVNYQNFKFGSIACADEHELNKFGEGNIEKEFSEIPMEFELYQNYPNPFNPSTQIMFSLKEDAQVRLEIYDVMGSVIKVLKDNYESAGIKEVTWDGTNEQNIQVPSGTYFYRIVVNNSEFVKTNKMLLLK